MARMTTTSNSNLLRTEFFAKRFVEAARETVVMMRFALREDAPRSNGKVATWQYFGNPSAVTTALTEGNDPTSPRDLATTTASATLEEYGDYFEPAKLFLSTAASGTMDEIIKAAGYQAGISLDTLCHTALQSTTNTDDLTDGVSLSAAPVRNGCANLKGNSEKTHRATTNGNYYALIVNPTQEYDLMGEGTDYGASADQEPTWERAHATDMGVRGSGYDGSPNATGRVLYGAEIFCTQNVQTEGGDSNAYMLADASFGAVSIDSDLLQPGVIVTMPNERVDKPLRNAGTVGWWVAFGRTLIRSNATREIVTD